MSAFSSVLIANRGEIACRVIDTLKAMGINAVAIYHRDERNARHVGLADAAYEIKGDTPVSAYLDGGQIIDLAIKAGAEAIHPGYGFLSENAGFAEAVTKAGLTFIGPDPDTIRLMGDKIESRAFAASHGVPVAPSVLPTGDLDAFIADAGSIGFPLLIKASAGGGGKGMSIVRTADEVAEAAHRASSEAERYFADPRIYAERYIDRPRHIEVQVFGDGEGNVVHLWERECSIQRRFQKIIEEAPSAGLADETRAAICDAAVRLAKAARYLNAGTVEFIMAPDGQFYFLEMNTRLQVEHPVTEMITGLDLVRMQVEVARSKTLPVDQQAVTLNGHAFECRICAEDPERDFLPQTGKVLALEPATGAGIRFENGLSPGDAVTTSFDPMLAKLVVHDVDRTRAAAATRDALDRTQLLGVTTNLGYLSRVVGHPAFRAGDLHTGFLAEHADALAEPALDDDARDAALIAAALSFREFRMLVDDVPDPYAAMGGWRN